jgi:translation initiation factor IF-2
MNKMATTRVYILAKELDVKSSAIVKKCQDEGLDVENHMAVISAGLAATIREWFSEGENVTTVETATKVDLDKVRIAKKPKRKRPETKVQKVEQAEPPTETIKAVEEPSTAIEVKQSEQEAVAVAVAEDTKVSTAPAVTIKEQPPTVQPRPVEVELKKPEPELILPAGPILKKPAPARLTGPQVVRIEAPELLYRPRPKPKERYNLPITEPLMYSQEEEELATVSTKDKKRPLKHTKERTSGRRRDEVEFETVKKPKFSSKWRQRDIEERQARLVAAGAEGLRLRPVRKIATKLRRDVAVAVRPQKAVVSEPITVKDLSAALAVKSSDIISKLVQHGVMATANHVISSDVAEIVALEFDTELVVEHKRTLEEQIRIEAEQRPRNSLKKRSVVAAVLGHVDHGKTSLLDKIRSTQVAVGEAGGITQHIGASQVTWDGKTVTFLDTPGHEAFTAMRARGANMTDVVVLVVAANDGVMPQTIEAIAHSRAAKVPIIVALNKIDLPGCDINRVYSQLAEQGLAPTEWGGQTEVVKTSAITGEGISNLLESLDYVAELLELKADDAIPATGWVVEAKISVQCGPVATLLIKEGCLNKGDAVLAGDAYGRVKAMKNSFSKSIKTATSAMPVEITGLSGVPQAGDRFYCLDDINRAKAAAEENEARLREISLVERTQVTLDNLFSQIEAGKTQELNLIVRADVQGSVDVLKKYLSELSTDEVKINILHAAPGGITEGDVVLAEASNAIIIGFNVAAEEHAAKMAETKGVDIRFYNIIYRITEELQKSMVGLLEPEEQEKVIGRAVVRATFKISRIGTVAGSYVTSGFANKNAKMRLIRDNIVLKDNLGIESLKHFKDDVREVKAGLECGIKAVGFDDIKIDDVFEFYEIIKVARTLQ